MRTFFILLLPLSSLAAGAKERGYTKKEVKRLDLLIRNLPEFKEMRARAGDSTIVRSFFSNASTDSANYFLYITMQRESTRQLVNTGTLMDDCIPGYFGKLAQPTTKYKLYESYLLKYDRRAKDIVEVKKQS